MQDKGWVACRVCGKSACANRRGGVHEGCAAEMRAEVAGGSSSQNGIDIGAVGAGLLALPAIADVFTFMSYTSEFTYKGLRSSYRQEFGRLCARVVQENRVDAWDNLEDEGGKPDTVQMQKCRLAWIELSKSEK